MGRLGFSKKSDNGDEDSNRKALFGSKPKNKSPAPASSNPYAQPVPTDPYTEAKMKTGVMRGGPPDDGYKGNGGPPPSKYQNNMPDGKYDSNAGYAPNRAGDQAAYGADRYGREGPANGGGSRFGAGGYGGLGSADPNDSNRDALFGGARERVQARSQHNTSGGPPPYSSHSGLPPNGGAPAGGDATTGTYGTYQDRQLTAEEEEEEDVQAMKQDIRDMKRQDVSSTRNALRAAQQAEETGRATLARLGAQGESLHNTEKNLDLAANQNRIAEDKARELRKVNKTMFAAMSMGNPFTSEKRRQARDEAILDRHQQERIQREETRMAAYRTEQRMQNTFKDMSKQGDGAAAKSKPNLAERSKYQFEADSEDEELEDEIDSNLEALHGAAGRLNALARATGKEVEEQNAVLRRVDEKVFTPILTLLSLVAELTSVLVHSRRRPAPSKSYTFGAHPLNRLLLILCRPRHSLLRVEPGLSGTSILPTQLSFRTIPFYP